jgi:hypothetical protein
MAREKNTVDYFPFYVKDGKTLYVLQKKYGLEGIGFFTQLFRYLSQVPEHWTCIQDEYDLSRLVDYIGIEEKKCIEMLEILAGTGKIDHALWKEKGIIVSEDFLDSLERVYSKRNNSISIGLIREKTKKIPALSGTFRHFPAIKERKGKKRKGNNYTPEPGGNPEPGKKKKPDLTDSKESVRLIISENKKILRGLTWTVFKKISPDHFKTEKDKSLQGKYIEELLNDCLARAPTIEGQKEWLGKLLRTWLYICKGKIRSFLTGSPFVPNILRSQKIWPRVLQVMLDEKEQEKIREELKDMEIIV